VNLVVLGATGSIGASTLDVAARHPERYRVFALSAHGSADQLARLCRRHRPRYAVLSSAAENAELRRAFSGIVAGNVKDQGVRLIEQHGPFELHGDPELLRPLDGLLEGFIRDRRMKIAGEYRPCYRLVA